GGAGGPYGMRPIGEPRDRQRSAWAGLGRIEGQFLRSRRAGFAPGGGRFACPGGPDLSRPRRPSTLSRPPGPRLPPRGPSRPTRESLRTQRASPQRDRSLTVAALSESQASPRRDRSLTVAAL